MRGETEPDVIVAGLPGAALVPQCLPTSGADVREPLRAAAGQPRLFVLEATGIVEIDFTAAAGAGAA